MLRNYYKEVFLLSSCLSWCWNLEMNEMQRWGLKRWFHRGAPDVRCRQSRFTLHMKWTPQPHYHPSVTHRPKNIFVCENAKMSQIYIQGLGRWLKGLECCCFACSSLDLIPGPLSTLTTYCFKSDPPLWCTYTYTKARKRSISRLQLWLFWI